MNITLNEIRHTMIYDGCGIYFLYKGCQCGLDISAGNSVYTFYIWYGTLIKYYDNFESAVSDPVFDGVSIMTLLDSGKLEINFF